MNTHRTFLVTTLLLAFTLVHSPAQIAPPATFAPSPTPIQQNQIPAPDQIAVNVLGAVNSPSRLLLPRGATLLDAIAAVGGLNNTANAAKVLLIHRTTGEKAASVKIDLRPILAGVANAATLRDGDTVMVPQRLISF